MAIVHAAEMLGRPPEDVLGRRIAALFVDPQVALLRAGQTCARE
jgi:hypothetical protein